MVVLSIYSGKTIDIFMFLYTTVLYEYMNLLRNDVCSSIRMCEFKYIVCFMIALFIANEGRHVRIINNKIKYPLCSTQYTPVGRQCLYLPIDNINVQTWTIPSISPIDNFHFLSSNIPTPRA